MESGVFIGDLFATPQKNWAILAPVFPQKSKNLQIIESIMRVWLKTS